MLSIILLTATILLLCQCSKTEFEDFSNEVQSENFSKSSKQLGLAVAKELNATIRNLHKKGVDYSNANETPEFKKAFYNDFYNASPSAIKTRSSASTYSISPEEFASRIKNLTKIQLEFINRIIDECGTSTSEDDFYNKLLVINNDIYTTVPEIQQERLLNVTAVLYYSMKEIKKLESQGLMIPTPRSNMQQVLVKTRSESSGGSFGDACRKFLATTWVIAVGEPTLAGEIVASIATVIVGGILLYEVVVCAKEAIDDHEYCMRYFETCTKSNTIPYNQCEQCYRYCKSQGFWNC